VTTHMIDQIVERAGTLPPLPDTILRLVRVVSDPDSSLSQIVEAVRYDQVLTAEVLRLCNSAYFGLVRRVESLDDAVCLLGTVRVFQLVMAGHARAALGRPQGGYGLRAGALWQHSVGVALGSQVLARRLHLTQMGLPFTGGLLHDVGKVVLNEFVAAEYAEIVRCVNEQRLSFVEAEQQVLGFTHAEVGARLAESWSLPGSIVHCVRWHHEPDAAEAAGPLTDAVHLADAVCLLLGVGGGDDGLLYRGHPAVLARHGLSQTDLETVGAEVVAELRTVQTLFAAK